MKFKKEFESLISHDKTSIILRPISEPFSMTIEYKGI